MSIPYSEHERVRATGRTWKMGGELQDFVLGVEVLDTTDGLWKAHILIDCSHGNAHVHYYLNGMRDGQEPESLLCLNSAQDVRQALGLSISKAREEVTNLVQALLEEG